MIVMQAFCSLPTQKVFAQTILSARVVTPPMHPVPSTGDLWMNTWADDGHIYTGWGDGEGPGCTDPGTDCGIAELKENVPYFHIEPDPMNYVCLTIDGLFEALHPWGPWTKVAPLLQSGDDPEWKDPESCEAGLYVRYYDLPPGSGETVPDFSTLSEYKTDIVPDIGYYLPRGGVIRHGMEFATSGRTDSVAALFTGFIDAPEDGIYAFYLLSDDASDLSIGDEKVVENYGEHWCSMVERAGQVGLKGGKHELSVGYTEITGLCGLRLYWEGPNFGRELVPASKLFYTIPPIQGDVNGDGTIDITDAVSVVNIILGLFEPTPEQFWAVDMNGDSTVDVVDIVMIVTQILERL